MGSDSLIVEAKMALTNWSKYQEECPTEELVYQANKMARVLEEFIKHA